MMHTRLQYFGLKAVEQLVSRVQDIATATTAAITPLHLSSPEISMTWRSRPAQHSSLVAPERRQRTDALVMQLPRLQSS